MTKLVIIGAGNVAYHLAKGLMKTSIEVVQVYNRSRRGLSGISKETAIPTTTSLNQIAAAEFYLIAVKDDAIEEIGEELQRYIAPKAIVAHTSGNCSIDILSKLFEHYGAFYPLQTFNKSNEIHWHEIPIFITGSNRSTSNQLSKVALCLSKKVFKISDKQRSRLHIPAVMVNNFVNHIYSLAYDYCKQHKLSFKHLRPLMEQTLDSAMQNRHPARNQTGPAVRGDQETIKTHREELKNEAEQLRLYNYITKHIKDYHENR